MCRKFTLDERNSMNRYTKNDIVYQMQDRLDKLEYDYDKLYYYINTC